MRSDQKVKRCLPAVASGAAAILPWLLISMSPVSVAATYPTEDYDRLHELYRWKQMDFIFPTARDRLAALNSREFVPGNSVPLALEVWYDRIFVTTPKWVDGTPASLSTVPRYPSDDRSPPLKPYPDWSWHRKGNESSCDLLTSVFRVSIDSCGRIWLIDSGVDNVVDNMHLACPPKIWIIDLNTDTLIRKYTFPMSQVKERSLFANIVTDVRYGECHHAYAYVADVPQAAMLVYSFKENRSWRIESPFFHSDPEASNYYVDGFNFTWSDNLFGMALGPVTEPSAAYPLGDRMIIFHALSSFKEYAVPASVLQNACYFGVGSDQIISLGCRYDKGQSAGSAMDKRGILFSNQVSRYAVWCWNSDLPYLPSALGEVYKDEERLIFPNDIRVDHEDPQGLWVLSNRLSTGSALALKSDEFNFRIWTATTEEATRGTVCDPEYMHLNKDFLKSKVYF